MNCCGELLPKYAPLHVKVGNANIGSVIEVLLMSEL